MKVRSVAINCLQGGRPPSCPYQNRQRRHAIRLCIDVVVVQFITVLLRAKAKGSRTEMHIVCIALQPSVARAGHRESDSLRFSKDVVISRYTRYSETSSYKINKIVDDT